MKKILILLLLISLLVLAALWPVPENFTVNHNSTSQHASQDTQDNPSKDNSVQLTPTSQEINATDDESGLKGISEKLP